MLPEYATAAELANLFDLTIRRINMLAKSEALPKESTNKFPFKLCVQWFLDRALAKPPARSDEDIQEQDALRASQIALNEARKKQVDIDVDTKRRALIPAEEVKTILAGLGVIFANGHESIAGRLAGEVSPEAQKRILEEMREVRSIVADEISEFGNSLNTGEDNLAPTSKERQPVGRAM